MQASDPVIGVISLGCPKALVDSEKFIGGLRALGFNFSADLAQSDIVIINTCGFLDSAQLESNQQIARACKVAPHVIVTGCLTGRDPARADELYKRFPNIADVSGPASHDRVVAAVMRISGKKFNPKMDLVDTRQLLTPRHFAYLKISEGCDHKCRFCIIPQIRGKMVSRPMGSILDEAAALADSGTKELVVIAQDTGAYGRDLGHASFTWRGQKLRAHILDLAPALARLGVWVRLMYLYPYPFLDELVPMMSHDGVLPYFDMPLQHASRAQLRSMRRPQGGEKMLARIAKWRQMRDDICIRSTFMLGFPGETQDDFEELLAWLKEARLDRVGSFAYENVKGAAANQLADHVDEETKQRRRAELMRVQAGISRGRSRDQLGKSLTVMVDEIEEDRLICRGFREAPQVDGSIFVDRAGDVPYLSNNLANNFVKTGDMIEVEINKSLTHDLWGRFVGETNNTIIEKNGREKNGLRA